MRIHITIIFKDGTRLSADNVKMDRLMLHITDELTMDVVDFGLYRMQGNVILGRRIDDEVHVKNIVIVPA